jgi:hypothetical protein
LDPADIGHRNPPSGYIGWTANKRLDEIPPGLESPDVIALAWRNRTYQRVRSGSIASVYGHGRRERLSSVAVFAQDRNQFREVFIGNGNTFPLGKKPPLENAGVLLGIRTLPENISFQDTERYSFLETINVNTRVVVESAD